MRISTFRKRSTKLLTSQMYFFVPNSSSLLHSVSMQNSGPTRQISPVLRQTTVGVPLYEMSLFNSCRLNPCDQSRHDRSVRHTYDDGALHTFLYKNLILLRKRHLKGDK